jgi:hypothetical protein
MEAGRNQPRLRYESPQGGTYVQVVTVKFADGTARLFDPDVQVETRPE